MCIIIKRMETDEEIRGKAYVHWKSWHETYSGFVSQEYLDKLTYKKCESMAFSWRDNLIVAMDGNTVIGLKKNYLESAIFTETLRFTVWN